MIAIDEENAGLRTERAELHSLLNDTAQELEQTKKELAETAGGPLAVPVALLSNGLTRALRNAGSHSF